MSRDSNGVYTLPAGNPVVSGTVISTAWANPTMDNIAAALTDSLSRSGLGSMTQPLLLADGSSVIPGLAFANETGTGFYRAGAADLRVKVTGFADNMRFSNGSVSIRYVPTANIWLGPTAGAVGLTIKEVLGYSVISGSTLAAPETTSTPILMQGTGLRFESSGAITAQSVGAMNLLSTTGAVTVTAQTDLTLISANTRIQNPATPAEDLLLGNANGTALYYPTTPWNIAQWVSTGGTDIYAPNGNVVFKAFNGGAQINQTLTVNNANPALLISDATHSLRFVGSAGGAINITNTTGFLLTASGITRVDWADSQGLRLFDNAGVSRLTIGANMLFTNIPTGTTAVPPSGLAVGAVWRDTSTTPNTLRIV